MAASRQLLLPLLPQVGSVIFHRLLRRNVYWSLALVAQVFLVWAAVECEAYGASIWSSVSIVVTMVDVACMFYIGILMARWRAHKTYAGVLIAATTISVGFVGNHLISDTRLRLFTALASRSDVVVEAAWEYCIRNGRPPQSIDDVASVLGFIPQTGLVRYPSYKILRGHLADEWGICVDCSMGLLSSDMLLYWPSEQYPSVINGGHVTPLGRWVFVIDMD